MAELANKLRLEVVTPERRVSAREVDEVILPGAAGSFGVLPGHAPLLSALQAGVAISRNGDKREVLAIGGGFVEVQPDRVIVLADTCEKADEIDTTRAKQRVAEYKAQLESSSAETDIEVVRAKMMKHMARLAAAEQKG